MIDDKTIINNYLKFKELKDSQSKPSKVSKYINSKYITQEEKDYLKNRWEDSSSLSESLYRIVYKLPERHRCPICGKFTEFVNKNVQIWRIYCSWECKVKNTNLVERHKQGCLRKYGVENISQVPGNRDKFAKTMIERYGYPNNFGRPEVNKTLIDKYGTKNVSTLPEFKEKIKQTTLNNHGYFPVWNDPEIREKHKESNKEKEYITKKKNGTLGKSQVEDNLYNILKEKYIDIIHHYKDKERYPFACDFYIPNLDLFIEYQGLWTHGGHPFDSNNENDLQQLELWKTKSKTSGYYESAIHVWTEADPLKRETAKKNNINYLEIWPDWTNRKTLDEIRKFEKI